MVLGLLFVVLAVVGVVVAAGRVLFQGVVSVMDVLVVVVGFLGLFG